MKKTTYTLFALIWFLFGFNYLYSQENFKSSSQEQCQWNVETHNYEQCEEFHTEIEIVINHSEGKIQINGAAKDRNFKILSTVDKSNETLFKVVSEEGVGKIITYNKKKNWIRLSDEQQSKYSRSIFYTIHQ